jgi:hypothetical protein
MNFYPHEINFDDVEADKQLVYDEKIASNPNEWKALIKFTRTFYNTDTNWDEGYANYTKMINAAIKSNNIVGVTILWDAIYHHDIDSPFFERDLITATQYGTFEMFLHVLYGYGNFNTIVGTEQQNYNMLCITSQKNPDKRVYNFLKLLEKDCLVINEDNQQALESMCESMIECIPSDDEALYFERIRVFYNIIDDVVNENNFVPLSNVELIKLE